MSSESVVLFCCLTCLLLPSILLQATGFFSPYWIKHNSTSDCFRGIALSTNCNDTMEAGLGTTVFGLQATALVIIALTTGVIMYSICCNKDGVGDVGCCTKCGVCVLCLYPAAGIIGFAGCMLVIKDYKDHEKGWSFYLSLATSCYVMLKSLVFCCATYKYAKTEKGTDNKDGKVNKSYVGNEVVQYGESGSSQDNRAMATSGDGGLILGHVQEHHHLEISRSGSIMIRKLQIARVFHIR